MKEVLKAFANNLFPVFITEIVVASERYNFELLTKIYCWDNET